jgi:amino acid adenylation domain-containing protein
MNDSENRSPTTPVPESAPVAERLPTSFAQQQMWLLDRLLGDGSVYNNTISYRLLGDLNADALRRALAEIVRRHEVLRTRFEEVDGAPVQVVTRESTVHLAAVDLTREGPGGASSVDRARWVAERARRLAIDDATAPFDLSQGPLVRARLVRLAEREHWLLLTLHHIVTDGWSTGVLARELSALYRTFVRGEASCLPELAIQYADFAIWQREWLQPEVLQPQLEYWRNALAGLPPLELPTDRPRPPIPSHGGGRVLFELGDDITRRIGEVARREGATPFMALLTAWLVLLSRYSGQDDFAVGVPVAGRNRQELEGLIGLFLNTLVLRADLRGEPGFVTAMDRVRDRLVVAIRHQDVPFEMLVDEVAAGRDPSRNPLFQAAFAFDNMPATRLALEGLEVCEIELPNQTAKFDLRMFLAQREARLEGWIEYAEDLFDRDRIERMAGHWRTLLEEIVRDPRQVVTRLPMLTEDEWRRLHEWNATAADFPRGTTVQRLFEEQARRTPYLVAVVGGGEGLTYAELDARANRLAQELRDLGVGTEVGVGLCLERSVMLVVGILGILKAGGAYVPLDPDYPESRLAFMVADSKVRVVVTQTSMLGRMPAHPGRDLCLDRDWPRIARRPAVCPQAGSRSTDLAYVIYTSGSSGIPKGVLIEQRSLVNHMSWMERRFPLGSGDRVLQKTPIGFDASVWEFLAPLLAGATLVMAKPGSHRSSTELVDQVIEHRVTVLQLVPAMLSALLEEERFGRCTTLRRVFCGGQTLGAQLVRRFHELSGAELVNLYGPTEATIDATYWVCPRPATESPVPIGRPVDNVQLLVLDGNLQAVPVGVPGELFLSGEALARGYLNAPAEQTARSFPALPPAAGATGRFYRTGDVVSHRPDGVLLFHGRNDDQVKIGGVRIELGEVEAVIGAHPDVRRIAAIVDCGAQGTRLIAFVVPHARVDVGEGWISALRRHARGFLPGPMIPSLFQPVDRIPLTPNGKVDRSALAASALPAGAARTPRRAPRTPAELAIADAFAEVLGLDQVGVDQDFFDLGGNSLSAMRVLARIGVALKVDLPVHVFFDEPTVESIASAIVDLPGRRGTEGPPFPTSAGTGARRRGSPPASRGGP